MSGYRSQALINAPVQAVWALLGDPQRHPEWWPRVIEVNGTSYDPGDAYVQKTQGPFGSGTTNFLVQRREELRELKLRCLATGTYAHWKMTEARGETFVDVEVGMEDPVGLPNRLFDLTMGKLWFRRWVDESVQGLEQAATRDHAAADAGAA